VVFISITDFDLFDGTEFRPLEVPVVEQVINAYTRITADAEFREIERQWELAQHNEASAQKPGKER